MDKIMTAIIPPKATHTTNRYATAERAIEHFLQPFIISVKRPNRWSKSHPEEK
jgi:hypothetical protein